MINVVLSGEQVETVDAKSFNTVAILDEHPLHRIESLLPVSVDHVELRFLEQSWEKVFVLN